MGNYIDLTGQRFGRLTVLRKANKKERKSNNCCYWICKCDCGNETVVYSRALRDGRTKSCGCLRSELKSKRNALNLTGQKFGRLTVTRKADDSERPNTKEGKCGTWWVCDCDCGTKGIIKKGTYLTSGRVKSCGCQKIDSARNMNVDITGKRFGMLTAIERTDPPQNDHHTIGAWWHCKCDCGGEINAPYSHLKDGHIKSCGCMISNGERIIREILNNNHVKFKPQYTFDDCRSPETGNLLKFDFGIFDKDGKLFCVIEFDGHQHYFGTRFSKNKEHNKEKFRKLKLHDSVKTDFCKENQIKLIRIPYWELDNVENIININLKDNCYRIIS